ncbi:MAG: EamA family transporter [Methylococcales bacterium]|nr:EamA family transporter [Methylococcales bacterium]
MAINTSILFALLAAALFGASTPFAKLLLGEIPPLLLGGLLYLGSGIGLGVVRLVRDKGWRSTGLMGRDWLWLLAAILFGGVLGPVFLLLGLQAIPSSTATLLLNLEAVLTALIAWVVFRENAGRRVVAGMIAIVAGGLLLSWPDQYHGAKSGYGAALVACACGCWAIDNNLTRKVSAADAVFIAGSKGLIAGTVNCSLALALGLSLPPVVILLETTTLGLFGYGASLALFVLALRGLGAARAGAYFSTAPFIGAAVALAMPGESASPRFWITAGLMAAGVWLHLTERHEHLHTHNPLLHSHQHVHDAHHQHPHDFDWDGREPHNHLHQHSVITHTHPHYPDIHHQH